MRRCSWVGEGGERYSDGIDGEGKVAAERVVFVFGAPSQSEFTRVV